MKTSNKILLGLAVLLIIVPILVVAINTKLNYTKKGFEDTYFGVQNINNEPFDKKSKGRIAIPIQSPFKAIQIKDAKGLDVQLFVKEDRNYGLKIQQRSEKNLKFDVDANGVLQITILDSLVNSERKKITVVIYCPSINRAAVANSSIFEFSAHADSLTLDVDNTQNLFLTGDITTNDAKGKIISTINPTKIGKLYLNLNRSTFSGYTNAFKDLYVNANKSEIEIGSSAQDKQFVFDNLVIKTTDTSGVRLERVKVKTFSGDFSDATRLEIATPLLKQLFKK